MSGSDEHQHPNNTVSVTYSDLLYTLCCVSAFTHDIYCIFYSSFGQSGQHLCYLDALGSDPHQNKWKRFSQDWPWQPKICRDSTQTSKCTLWLKSQSLPAIFRRKNSLNYASLDSTSTAKVCFFISGRWTEGIQLDTYNTNFFVYVMLTALVAAFFTGC